MKKRILIPVIQHFAIRYLLRTGMIKEIASLAQPVILLGWNDDCLIREMEEAGAEVHQLPRFRHGSKFEHVRSRINYWHRLYRRTPTTAIDRRRNYTSLDRKTKTIRTLREMLMRFEASIPGGINKILEFDERYFWDDTNAWDFEAVFLKARPDLVFSITPFLMDEEPILRIAKREGIPLVTAILSFDNLTSRTWIPIIFNRYLVWNKYNQRELLRGYPDVDESQISITGPPQFDFYWDGSYIWDEQYWRHEIGLDNGEPVILFGAGSQKIVPNEPYWLLQLDQAIQRGEIPDHPVILFRRHPVDFQPRWDEILGRTKHVVIDNPWLARETEGHTNISRYDIERLASNLKYCAVHINASSTLTVDGSIFDKPQIGPAYDAGPDEKFDRILRELYTREHYLPITNSGGLDIPESRDEFIANVNDAFKEPGKKRDGRKKLVQEICTFVDGNSTTRVTDTLKKCLNNASSQ